MSADNVTQKRRAADWKPSGDIEAVKEAANTIDSLSQTGFGRIKAISRLALLSLEVPDGHRGVENLAAALEAISAIADDTENCINSEAESVACSYRDEAWMRRHNASLAFLDSQRKEAA